MLYYSKGNEDYCFSNEELKSAIHTIIDKIGDKKKVLIIPPDFTRFHSRAGEITEYIYEYLGNKVTDILPALGIHYPMTDKEIKKMFGKVPLELFKEHDWRNKVTSIGEVPADYVKEISNGAVDYSFKVQINEMLLDNYDLILSIGQVVPHEVIGMANYNKNIFVGVGGADFINKSHFLGAAYGMEQIMGKAENPVRDVFNYASAHFAKDLPIVYIQTVLGRNEEGSLDLKGVYASDDIECFNNAAKLSLKVNFEVVEKPLKKVVVYLDPEEFKSTWLGNKSVYRTRMAIADEGELIVLAPGLKEFGEDKEIDKLIRKYGYKTTPEILDYVKNNDDLRNNLGAAAHLIHGSSENRFKITYCPGDKVTKEEIEGINFNYGSLEEMSKKYDINKLKDGYNILENGEEIFYISNPATGLWAYGI